MRTTAFSSSRACVWRTTAVATSPTPAHFARLTKRRSRRHRFRGCRCGELADAEGVAGGGEGGAAVGLAELLLLARVGAARSAAEGSDQA